MPVRRARTQSPQASDYESANDVFFWAQTKEDHEFRLNQE